MTKPIQTKKQDTIETTTEIIETIEQMELEDVTGGCARCGCGTTAETASLQLAATWQR